MDCNIILEKINEIILCKTNIDFQEQSLWKDCNLFCEPLCVAPRDLVNVLFEIENAFNITISQDIILSRRFGTFNQICNAVIDEIKSEKGNK